jgi:hypothetical protein
MLAERFAQNGDHWNGRIRQSRTPDAIRYAGTDPIYRTARWKTKARLKRRPFWLS